MLKPQIPDGANDGDGVIAQQTDCQLSYSGQWNSTSTTSASGGSFAYSCSPGASVTIAFTGTHVSWIGKMSPLYGLATVSLDGAEPVTVDLYSPTILWQQVVWESGELEDGPHTVTITCTGQKSPDATEANISLDALTVAGSLE